MPEYYQCIVLASQQKYTMPKLYGHSGDDGIRAIDEDDTMIGFAGDDDVISWSGNELTKGVRGNEPVLSETGDDFLLSNLEDARHAQSIKHLPAEGNESHLAQPGHELYVPGDNFKVIDRELGINTLRLKQIFSREVAVTFLADNWLSIAYRGEPIVKMRGVESIQTDDGCFSIFHWL